MTVAISLVCTTIFSSIGLGNALTLNFLVGASIVMYGVKVYHYRGKVGSEKNDIELGSDDEKEI
jgi:hypothetical protein